MANRANEYPDEMICPLADMVINVDDCLENQDCVDGVIKISSLPERFRVKKDFAAVCMECKYHEIT